MLTHMFVCVSISEEPIVLEGQTSIEDLLAEPALRALAEGVPLQDCLPGMEEWLEPDGPHVPGRI